MVEEANSNGFSIKRLGTVKECSNLKVKLKFVWIARHVVFSNAFPMVPLLANSELVTHSL
jgi:hypothetical protein